MYEKFYDKKIQLKTYIYFFCLHPDWFVLLCTETKLHVHIFTLSIQQLFLTLPPQILPCSNTSKVSKKFLVIQST